MYQYQIYGLNILSSRKIKLLKEQKFSKADLTVDWNVSTSETPDSTNDWKSVTTELLDKINEVSLWETENEKGFFTKVSFKLEEIRNLNFLLDSEKEKLWIYHQKDEPENDLESYFVGPVLSFVLRLRGVICLNSSVVGIDGKAIAFPGHATAGKSTIAAGMADAGAEILADDIAVLIPHDDMFFVQPGYERVRLRPIAADFLTENPDDLPMVYSYRESRYVAFENRNVFQSNPLPLSAIYVLGEFSDDYKEPFIEPIEIQDKVINLVKNTSGSYVITKNLRATEFKFLTQIAKTIPMRKLFYAHDIKTLPQQCELIIEDFRKIIKNFG